MNTDTFLKNFAHYVDAPNGISKLRELILQLAVQGKLVEQNPDDGDARELLENAKRKNKLVRIKDSEVPFALPSSWTWVHFGDIFDIQGGGQPPKSQFINQPLNGYIRLLQIRDFGPNPVPTYVPSNSVNRTCSEKDVMLARYGASVGKIFMGQEGAYNVALTKVLFNYKYIYNRYVFFLLKSELFQQHLRDMSRSAQAGFNKGNIHPILLPLPPLEEQKRIVAKVDELMHLTDKLELEQNACQATRVSLSKASFSALAGSENAGEFSRNWLRVSKYFGELVRTPEDVQFLRQSILQLAVQGKLVEQNPDDGDARELLEKIQISKETSARQGKIKWKKNRVTSKIKEVPYSIPKDWIWVRLEHITDKVHYGYTASSDSTITDIRLLRITDIQNNHVNWATVPGCEIDANKIDSYRLKDGDILIARTGGTIGKSYLVNSVSVPAVFASYLIRAIPTKPLFPQYLKLYLESDAYWHQLYAKSMGTGQPNVNATSLKQLLVPLPPLKEQKRIVAKVDSLMAYCDSLEKLLSEKQNTAEKLVAATVLELAA